MHVIYPVVENIYVACGCVVPFGKPKESLVMKAEWLRYSSNQDTFSLRSNLVALVDVYSNRAKLMVR